MSSELSLGIKADLQGGQSTIESSNRKNLPRLRFSESSYFLSVELTVAATEQDPWLSVYVIVLTALVLELLENIVGDLYSLLLESAS